MLRAIFNMVGSSNKNNAWSCAVQFELYMQSLGKSSNFFDPVSARFGKYIEMGLIVAANFKELKTFFETCPITCSESANCILTVRDFMR